MIEASTATLFNQIEDRLEHALDANDYKTYSEQLTRLQSMKLSEKDLLALLYERTERRNERAFDESLKAMEAKIRSEYSGHQKNLESFITQSKEQVRQERALINKEIALDIEIEQVRQEERLNDWQKQKRTHLHDVRVRAGQSSGQRRKEQAREHLKEVARLYEALKRDGQCPPDQISTRITERLGMKRRTVQHRLQLLRPDATNKNSSCSVQIPLAQSAHDDKSQARPNTDKQKESARESHLRSRAAAAKGTGSAAHGVSRGADRKNVLVDRR